MSKDDYFKLRRTYKEIEIGETASWTRTISERDVEAFAALIGDKHPIHIDAEYAKGTVFGERIAHGIFTASFFTPLIASRLSGIDGIYVSQEIRFIRPVRIGDTIIAHATVTGKDEKKKRITLKTTVTNQHGELIIDGMGVVAMKPGSNKESQ